MKAVIVLCLFSILQVKSALENSPGDEVENISVGSGGSMSERIINGEVASRGMFPWQVRLVMDNSSTCGGSLIATEWVLTAAHCLDGYRVFRVVLGASFLRESEPGRIVLQTEQKIVHPYYTTSPGITNDIGLLKLPSYPTPSMYIRPIRLPSFFNGFDTFDGYNVTTSGWGRTANGSGSQNLMWVDLQVITNLKCAAYFGVGVAFTPSLICTSGQPIRGTCNGDSGSALVLKDFDNRMTQIGLTSYGTKNCTDGAPSVFTRVSHFLHWISLHTDLRVRSSFN